MTPEEKKQKKQQLKKERAKKLAQEKTAAAKKTYAKRKRKLLAAKKQQDDLYQRIAENGPTRFVLENGGIGPAVRNPAFTKYGFKNSLKMAAMQAAVAVASSPKQDVEKEKVIEVVENATAE
jgi:hypothetical protein